MNLVAIIGMTSAVLTTGAFVPQAWKTIKSRSAEDLSLATFSMMFCGTVLWLVYGLKINDLPMICANAVSALLSGIILTMKLMSISASRKKTTTGLR